MIPSILSRLLSDERAATAIEYTLIALLISIAGIVAMTDIGQRLKNLLEGVAAGFPS
jgi:pilus assembly protein Flp/PilA